MTTTIHYICVHCKKTIKATPGRPPKTKVKANDVCEKCLKRLTGVS